MAFVLHFYKPKFLSILFLLFSRKVDMGQFEADQRLPNNK